MNLGLIKPTTLFRVRKENKIEMSDQDLTEIQKEVFFPALKEVKKVQILKRYLHESRMEFFHQFEIGNII